MAPGATGRPPRIPVYSRWWAVLWGAGVGLLLRLVFSHPAGKAYEPMMGAFIFGAPLACGAVTVYLAERQARRSWSYYIAAPVVATSLLVLGALIINIEGLICAIAIVPLFAIIGAVGGLLMGIVCRLTLRRGRVLGVVLALPLALGGFEHRLPLSDGYASSTQSLWIAATPEQVWPWLLRVDAISPADSGHSLAWRIGVPRPLSAHTVQQNGQWVRKSEWHKGIRFDEVITELRPGQRIAWQYAFKPGDVPPGALDDHVAIGGRYFDLLDSRYELTPEAGGTRLSLTTRWRVSTRFNAYALPLSHLLIDDLSRQLLAIYKTRSEQRG
jgi:hypothetical protein